MLHLSIYSAGISEVNVIDALVGDSLCLGLASESCRIWNRSLVTYPIFVLQATIKDVPHGCRADDQRRGNLGPHIWKAIISTWPTSGSCEYRRLLRRNFVRYLACYLGMDQVPKCYY